MALSKDEIEHIAHLARLEVSQDEIADYVNKLSSIIDLVAHLGSVDTANVLPMAHPLDMGQRLRAAEVTERRPFWFPGRTTCRCSAARCTEFGVRKNRRFF